MKEHSSNMKWEINSETEQEVEYSFFKLAENFIKVRGLNKNLKKIEEISNVKRRREALISFVAENLKEINNWILLFDNVKDIRTIQEYLPNNNEVWGNGFVVITTRNAKLSDRAPFSQKSHIKISELTPNEQLDLFVLIRGLDRSIEDKKENLKTLLQNIPLLPLDTAIAAYYVKNTCVVLNDYIRYLQEFSYDFQKVQAQIAINHIDYDKTRFSIIASDFNEIICSNSEFKELLLFVCLMNPQYISIKHLKQLKNSVTVDNFIYELQKYSLIYANENIFNMHRFIQKTGLYYIITEFSKKDIILSLEKIINTMAVGSGVVNKLSLEECLYLSRHIESTIYKIDLLKIDEKKKQEYKIRLSNTLLYCYIHFKPREFIKDFSKQIIDDNARVNLLSQEDLAELLETCGNACLFFKSYEEADKYLSKCLTVCENNDKLQYTKAICMCDLAMLYGLRGNSQEARQKQNQAFDFIKSSKNSWPLKVKEELFARYYWCYKELFVYSTNAFQQIIDLGQDILKDLGANNFFYKKGIYEGNNHENIFLMRRDLVALYNKTGDFNTAFESVQESEFFLEQLKKKGISILNREATFRMRQGYTLLRLNKLKEARANLERCIEVHMELGETPCIAQAMLYLSEVLIQLNKLEEAYKCAKKALAKMQNVSSNNDKFFKATCCYFLAILEIKNDNISQAMQYLNEFLNISNDVCKIMLDNSVYASLLQKDVFAGIQNLENIQTGFKNATKIFESVYEPSHSFLTNFVTVYGNINIPK